MHAKVAVLHSGLKNDDRHAMWKRLHRGEVHVAIGARSAVFAPVRDLGLEAGQPPHDRARRLVPAEAVVQVRELVVAVGRHRLQLDGSKQRRDGVLQPPRADQRQRLAVAGEVQSIVERERAIEGVDRFVVFRRLLA